jgi:Protein of unknown function (DUF3522)
MNPPDLPSFLGWQNESSSRGGREGKKHVDMLRQEARPSLHSAAVLASNAAFFVLAWRVHRFAQARVAAAAAKRGRAVSPGRLPLLLFEPVAFATAGLVSVLFHACDENIICSAASSSDARVPETAHFADIAATFYGVIVACVWVAGSESPAVRESLRTLLLFLSLPLIYFDRFSIGVNIALWVLPPAVCIGVLLWHGRVPRLERRWVLRGILLLVAGVGCFLAANLAGTQAARDRARWIPDTPFYWFFHSCWHILSCEATFSIMHAAPESWRVVDATSSRSP